MGSLSSLLVAFLGLGLAYNSIFAAEARPLSAGSPREVVVGMLIIPYYWRSPSPPPPSPASPSGPSQLFKGTPGGSFSAPRTNQGQSIWISSSNSYLQRSPAPPPPPPKVSPPSHPVKEDSPNTGDEEDFHDMMGGQSGSHPPPPPHLKTPTLFGSGSPDYERPSTSPPPPPRVSPPSHQINNLDETTPQPIAAASYVASY